MIHGDIKPQNVLVFKDAIGKTTVKVTDFGYSTHATGKEGTIILPRSRPWNAPEHHFGEFTAPDAKMTDVYSFGMLCLWVLFGNSLSDMPQTATTETAKLISFDESLECLKHKDEVQHIASQFVELMPELNTEDKNRLKEFFTLTVPFNPEKRTSDLAKLISLLCQER